MHASDVQRRLDDKRYSPFKPIPVATDVQKETIIYIREHQTDYPGVGGVQLTERFYPDGPLAAHLLGWVGEINGGELAGLKKKGYREGDNIGKSGIEKVYEDDLRGKPQVERLEVDSKGRVLRSLGTEPGVQGQYAPGSTFKLATALAALKRGIIDPTFTLDDGGRIKIGNRIFKNAGGEANGRVNIVRALTVSSDVFFYNLGNQFWNQRSQFG